MDFILSLIVGAVCLRIIVKFLVEMNLRNSKADMVTTRVGIGVDSEIDTVFPNALPIRWLVKRGMLEIDGDRILDSNGIDVKIEQDRSDEAVVLIHGITGGPRISLTVNNTFSHLKKVAHRDIYLPLVKYHGKGSFPFGYDPAKAREKLLKDLNSIIDFGYSKVYIFASSHSALQIMNMSINGDLNDKFKIIFMCPQIYTKFFSLLTLMYGFFAIYGVTSIIKGIIFEKMTNWLLHIDTIKNDFGYILIRNDYIVNSDYAEKIFMLQDNLRIGFYLSNYNHYIIPDRKFYNCIDILIHKMSRC